MRIQRRFRLILRASVAVALVLTAKVGVHLLGWEFISVNPLFSGIVAGNVFLMGFLLSGVLADFKESERIPGEFAASLENLAQEIRGMGLSNAEAKVAPCLQLVAQISRDLVKWFHKQHRTRALLDHLDELTPHFATLEQWTQGTLLARLKQEQSSLRRLLIRAHTIRETSFISSGYLIADAITVVLCVGLVFAKIEPFREALFFVTVISFLLVFLLMLIRDLDNPFGYYEGASSEDVSLKPIVDAAEQIEASFLKTQVK